jgi:hypothetical protein
MTLLESDWKKFTKLKKTALSRFCERVLAEIDAIRTKETLSSHDQYLEIFALIEKRDRELAQTFDYHSRSKALFQLHLIVARDLLEDEELSQFSEETRKVIESSRS